MHIIIKFVSVMSHMAVAPESMTHDLELKLWKFQISSHRNKKKMRLKRTGMAMKTNKTSKRKYK